MRGEHINKYVFGAAGDGEAGAKRTSQQSGPDHILTETTRNLINKHINTCDVPSPKKNQLASTAANPPACAHMIFVNYADGSRAAGRYVEPHGGGRAWVRQLGAGDE